MGSTHDDWAARLGCSDELGNEPEARHAAPAAALTGSVMRSQYEVMVLTLSWMAPFWSDWFPLELSGGLSQSDASEHTPLAVQQRWHGSPPIDDTSCPPRQR
jgi:hypothetical protein